MAWTTALLLVLGIAACGVTGKSFLSKLAKHVKMHCDPDVAPQNDPNNPVRVKFTYALMNIADVDREHNTITTEAFVMSQWQTDITWNPADYRGVEMITLPRKYFWTPNLQPIHTAVEMKDLSPQSVTVMHNGTIAYNQLYRMVGLCDVSNVETGAKCSARSSIWGYSMDQVVIAEIRGDTTGAVPFFEGSKYQITAFSNNIIEFPFDGKVYQIVGSSMTIQEKPHHRRGPMRMFFEWH